MFNKQSRLNRMLLRAAKRGDEQKALAALAQGAEINCTATTGQTPLLRAIAAGKWSMACLLVEKGADVQGAPPAQKTPLMHAVEAGDAAIVRLLLEAGAAPDAIHTYTTSQTYERQDEDSGIFGLFRETSCYTVSTTHHLTALTLAAHGGKPEVVRLLLGAGASRELRGKDGMNALACAEANGHKWVALLLRAPVSPAPAKVEQRAGDVVFRRPLGECFLEEIFDFTARERISLIRAAETGPVELTTREPFSSLVDTPSLRAAFNEHVRLGGTTQEHEVFGLRLDKQRLNAPRLS